MPQSLLAANGSQPQHQSRHTPIYTSRFVNGLYTNRSPLRGPLDSLYTDFYHMGMTDVLIDGINTELSIRSTMIRRPGNPQFCNQNTAGAVNDFYSFHQSDGTIKVIADSTVDVEVLTPTTLTSIFTKTAGSGQSYFQGIDKSLYIADGIDLVKYIPSAVSPIWNWGGVAPTVAPGTAITQTGSAGVPWQANSVYSTMGLLVDGAGNVQQLSSVNAIGDNPTSFYGTSSSGQPLWNNAPGSSTTDNTITWENKGPIVAWAPNKTFDNILSTIGANPCIIFDPISQSCYTNHAPGNAPGITGTTRPKFTGVFGSVIWDGNPTFLPVKWVCIGTPKAPALWIPNHAYPAFETVSNNDSVSSAVEPITPAAAGVGTSATPQTVFWMVSHGGTSATTTVSPKFGTTAGAIVTDGQLQWTCLGSATWAAGANYTAWSSSGTLFSAIKDANGNLQVAQSVSGVSDTIIPGTTASLTAASNASGGNTTYTGTFSPVFPSSLHLPVVITGFVTSANNGTFSIVSCSSTQLVVNNSAGVAETHAGTAQYNPWQTLYGQNTKDGGVVWVCVGQSIAWAAATIWYLPSGGFAPPSQSQAYGGAVVLGAANNQYVIQTGKSGGSAPAWGAIGTTTVDNTITWFTLSAFTAVGAAWTKGRGYVYCFKARKSSDVYVSTAPPLQIPGTNSPNITGPLGAPTGCGDGTVTTASPVTQIVGANAGAQVLISGPGSTDPQFDTVSIFRSADGFQASGPYLFLTDIPMPPMIGTLAGRWSIIDFMADTATNTLPGLNPLLVAPISHANDPVPGQYGSTQFVQSSASTPTVPAAGTGMVGVTYHQGRLWGFIGNSVFASGGPDTNPGNGFTAWPPANVFPFQSNVVRLLPTTAGLLVFTTTDLAFIGGGPAMTDYYSQVIVPGLGLLSWNAVTLLGGIPYLFSSDRQILAIDNSNGVTRVGHNIGDKLSAFNPANAYVTYHSFGDGDHALFVGDGATQWYRCDTNPSPDGRYTGPVWSPRATIAGGMKAIKSVETSPGTHQLLIGPSGVGTVLARDSNFSTFTDNGSAYSSFFTIGNVVLAHPGQMAQSDFIEMDFQKLGTQPTVSVLLDEIFVSGAAQFETISNSFVTDPPKKFGPTAVPVTLWMNRYYFSQTTPANTNQVPAPIWCKSMQVKVDFGATDTVENELMTFTIFGALWAEK